MQIFPPNNGSGGGRGQGYQTLGTPTGIFFIYFFLFYFIFLLYKKILVIITGLS